MERYGTVEVNGKRYPAKRDDSHWAIIRNSRQDGSGVWMQVSKASVYASWVEDRSCAAEVSS